MEIDHDLDRGADGFAERFHHPSDFVDFGKRRVEMRVGDKDRLECIVSLRHHLMRALHERFGVERFIHGTHVAKAEMGIDVDLIADPAAQKTPDRDIEPFAENVPERDFNA